MPASHVNLAYGAGPAFGEKPARVEKKRENRLEYPIC